MEIISISELDEKGWEKYYILSNKLDGTEDKDISVNKGQIEAYKKERLDDYKLNIDRFQDEKVFFSGGEAADWVAYRLDRRGSSFAFNSICKPIPDSPLNAVLTEVYNFICARNEETTFYWSFNENTIEAMNRISAPLFEEMMITRISRDEMDKKFYESIISETVITGYELKFVNNVPDEMLDKYVIMRSEISEDMAMLKPVKHESKKWTRRDIIRIAETDKLEGATMWMYMLLDRNQDIAGFCSLYIDSDNADVIRQSGGLTAVGRSNRGKGFARYLKAMMNLKLLEENKTFKFVETDTMPWNKYMYRINEEFGFKPVRYGSEFKLTKQFLENYLNNK